MKNNNLKIHGARENNLKSVSTSIPHSSIVGVTGLSGSGKSSFAFDTVYAEGQRRYIETFSPYTRQFLDKVKKPDVDLIENVRPAIAIQQRVRVTNSRSTVGSMTNINDYLKIVWAALAHPVCPHCGDALTAWTAEKILQKFDQEIASDATKTFFLGFTIQLSEKKKSRKEEIDRLILLGFSRFYNPATNEIELLEDAGEIKALGQGEIFIALDRIKPGSFNRKRVKEVVTQVYSRPDPHLAVITLLDSKSTLARYRPYPECQRDNVRIEKQRPALFSYNHPYGACPSCKGFGRIIDVDKDLCVPNQTLSIREGALQCWSGKSARHEMRDLISFCGRHGISVDAPWRELSEAQKDLIFNTKSKEYWGVIPWFRWLEGKAYKMHVRVFLSRYRSHFICPECQGSRLRSDALVYQINGKKISDIWETPIGDLVPWLNGLDKLGKGTSLELSEALSATRTRLEYLLNLGLPYLTLNRQARTLSGGETQRVNLAAALGSSLTSTHFVLDEPSVGLHPRDTRRLIESISGLQKRGNSVLIVEHDLECLNATDHIIEIGPKAGVNGGEIVYSGERRSWKGIKRNKITLSTAEPSLTSLNIKNAKVRNLKNLSLSIPLNRFVCLSGVSGSGKSTLAHEVIYRNYLLRKNGQEIPVEIGNVTGFEQLQDLVIIDQSPLSKTPRANIATYVGIWENIRMLLARSPAAEKRALTKSSFSFNVDGGRCPHCKGAGFIREDMQFLSDVFIPCDICLGKRFQPTVLEVQYEGYSADQLLNLDVDSCIKLFSSIPAIAQPAKILSLLGLGHLTLGHPLSELSGGEAQRLKLVPYVEQESTSSSMLIFDEPTTGLHLRDVERLLELFRILVERGNSLLCIEHNLEVLANCDYLIDLGPEGGEQGGSLLCHGRPKELIREKKNTSETIQFLKEYIGETEDDEKKKPLNLSRRSNAFERSSISIQGATEHNLKNVSLEVPLNKLVAFTGVSGSGKSTIAKDIIYAEGQRRYLDCLSPYARQFIKELRRPHVVSIDNIPPTICVYQHTFQPSAHSTVGTMSEAYNFMRLLFSKVGIQHCPDHPDQPIVPTTPLRISENIHAIHADSIRILAPVVKSRKGLHKDVFERAIRSEISEVRVDGAFASPTRFEKGLVKSKVHTIEFVTAKFNPKRMTPELINEAVLQTLSLSGGAVVVQADNREIIFSSERTCPICQQGFYKPDPEDLSFSSKRGACSACSGSGKNKAGTACESCRGTRLQPMGRSILLNGHSISALAGKNPGQILNELRSLNLDASANSVAQPIFRELFAKLETLIKMGLEYLSLDRDCSTLSGGELQRLRLAAAIGSPLSGVLYIFDEPSIGLHPLDNQPVIQSIKSLKDQGNSVIIIEHDPEMILACDHIIDVGPGGGQRGGAVVFSGEKEIFKDANTETSRELYTTTKQKQESERPLRNEHTLSIKNGCCHNIEGLSLDIPLQQMVVVAGVSGAGKSSLVHGIVAESIECGKQRANTYIHNRSEVSTTLPIKAVITIDQKPIGANSRSTPASYLGIWDEVRKLFAASIEAKSRGWTQSFFSYNTGKGRCPECKGLGLIKFEMNFLPDSFIGCETCQGQRFSEDALSVRFNDHNVSDVLNLTFEQALPLFSHHRKIHHALHHACELGLGYLTIGQSSTTLSGGESQRIKLVSEISAPRKEHTLYIFDEPTVGLHKADVARLSRVLRALVSHGHSVLIIEHDRDIVSAADKVIELGPGAASNGGKVIFQGTPNQLLKSKSPWGAVLRSSETTVCQSDILSAV